MSVEVGLKEGAAKEGEGWRRADAAKRRAAAPCATEKSIIFAPVSALVAKLVDAPDLGSGGFGRVGSSPIRRTYPLFLRRPPSAPNTQKGQHPAPSLLSEPCRVLPFISAPLQWGGGYISRCSPTSTLIGRYYFAHQVVAFLENPRGYYRFFGRRIGSMNVITSEGPRIVRKGAV